MSSFTDRVGYGFSTEYGRLGWPQHASRMGVRVGCCPSRQAHIELAGTFKITKSKGISNLKFLDKLPTTMLKLVL